MTATVTAPTTASTAPTSLGALLERMGQPLEPGDYDWDDPDDPPPTDEEVFQLTYAAQVEWGTEGTFVSLDTSRDPLIRGFLGVWLEQEVVHAELLARYLAGHGHDVAALHRLPEQQRAARRGRTVNLVARNVLGDDFTAVHMAWGAVNELTTLRFYGLLRQRTRSPLLARLLRDVMAQESRHYSFYRRAATDRLEDNRRAQHLVRFALRRLWSPVGTGLRSPDDADRLMRGLFEPEPDTVTQIDAAIGAMPGLDGVDLIRGLLREPATGP